MSEAKIWYIVVDGKADGPHTETQVRDWLRGGKLHFSDLVFRPGLSKWVTISDCKEFERREPPQENTAGKLDVPDAKEAPASGWILLVKHSKMDGKGHYIQSGPYSTEQIQEKLKKGELKYDAHVWCHGMKTWASVASVSPFDRRSDGSEMPSPASPVVTETATAAVVPVTTNVGSEVTNTFPLGEGKAKPASAAAINEPVKASVKAETEKVQVQRQPTASPAGGDLRPKWSMSDQKPEVKPEIKSDIKVEAKPEPKLVAKPEFKPALKVPEAPKSEIPKGAPATLKPVELKTPAIAPQATPAVHKIQPAMAAVPQQTDTEIIKSVVANVPRVKNAPRDLNKDAKKSSAKNDEESSSDMENSEVSMVTAVRTFKRRRLAIGGGGVILGLVLAYAGMTAYHEIVKNPDVPLLRKAFPVAQRVPQRMTFPSQNVIQAQAPAAQSAPQAQRAPMKQAPAARPRIATDPNETLPDPFADNGGGGGGGGYDTIPVNPEAENPPVKTPSTLRLLSLKAATDHPQLAMETDLPGGSVIDVQVTARAGTILRYPSFYLEREVTVVPGSMPSLDLSEDKLPPGDYRVIATSGGLMSTVSLPVGPHDGEFRKALAEYKKKVARMEKAEAVTLKSGVGFVSRNFASLNAGFRKARSPSPDAKKNWAMLIRNWRRDFEKTTREMPRVNDHNRNQFAYPEPIMKLRSAALKLNEVVRFYDHEVHASRAVASHENDPSDDLREQIKDLRRSISGM